MNEGMIEVRGRGRATVDPDIAVVALTSALIRDTYSNTMTALNRLTGSVVGDAGSGRSLSGKYFPSAILNAHAHPQRATCFPSFGGRTPLKMRSSPSFPLCCASRLKPFTPVIGSSPNNWRRRGVFN